MKTISLLRSLVGLLLLSCSSGAQQAAGFDSGGDAGDASAPFDGQSFDRTDSLDDVGFNDFLAMASSGSELAVVFSRSDWTILLQRLDGAGHRKGGPVALGTIQEYNHTLALVADGDRWLACWNAAAADVQCGSVSMADGATLPAHHVADGASPSLAFSNGVVGLSYLARDPSADPGAPPQLATVRLEHGARSGAPLLRPTLCAGPCPPDWASAWKLTPAADGFLLLSGYDKSVHAYWLDTTLAPKGPAIDLGFSPYHGNWATVAIGSGAVIWSAWPYGFDVVTIDRTHVVSWTHGSCGNSGKEGLKLPLYQESGAVSAVWGSTAASARHGTLIAALGLVTDEGQTDAMVSETPLAAARTHGAVFAVLGYYGGAGLDVLRASSNE